MWSIFFFFCFTSSNTTSRIAGVFAFSFFLLLLDTTKEKKKTKEQLFSNSCSHRPDSNQRPRDSYLPYSPPLYQLSYGEFLYKMKVCTEYILSIHTKWPCGAMDSALDFGSSGCGFESRHGCLYFSLFVFRSAAWSLFLLSSSYCLWKRWQKKNIYTHLVTKRKNRNVTTKKRNNKRQKESNTVRLRQRRRRRKNTRHEQKKHAWVYKENNTKILTHIKSCT